MYYRKALKDLENKLDKPVLIEGVRQVGKTTLARQYCINNDLNYIEFNFIENPNISKIFEDSLNPDDIIIELEIILGVTIRLSDVLIFDEIQECPQAIASLRFSFSVNSFISCFKSSLSIDWCFVNNS